MFLHNSSITTFKKQMTANCSEQDGTVMAKFIKLSN